MRVSQHFAELLETVGQSEANRYNYSRRLESFLVLHGEKELESIAQADVNSWLAMLKARGYADTTLTGYRQSIKTLFNFAVNQNRLLVSPARHIKTGSTLSQRPKLPAEASVAAITAKAIQWLTTDNPQKVRTAAFWLLSRAAGPRWGELHKLSLSEVSNALESGRMWVKSYGKTGEVVLRFNQQVADALAKWLSLRPKVRIDRCFITTRMTITKADRVPRFRPLSRSGGAKALIDLAKKAGVGKAVLTHALRHRLGDSLTVRVSPKVAAMALNHRDWQTAKTAIAYYHHPNEEMIAAAIDELAQTESDDWNAFFGVGG